MELKRSDSIASDEFSIHTIPSNRNSLKNNVQKEKVSNRRLCWIVANIVLTSVIFVNLFCSMKFNHYYQGLKIVDNRTWTLSSAINEVLYILLRWINYIKVQKYEDYFEAIISLDEENEIKSCPSNYILSKEKLLKGATALFIRGCWTDHDKSHESHW